METGKLVEVVFAGTTAEQLEKVLEAFAEGYETLRAVKAQDLINFLFEGDRKAGHRIKIALRNGDNLQGDGGVAYRQIRQYAGHKPRCEQLVVTPLDPEIGSVPYLYLRDFRSSGGWMSWIAVCDFSSQPIESGEIIRLATVIEENVHLYNRPRWTS